MHLVRVLVVVRYALDHGVATCVLQLQARHKQGTFAGAVHYHADGPLGRNEVKTGVIQNIITVE